MSIRWKLFLTLFLVTAGATALVLVVAEREFREWVKREAGQRFEDRVEGLLESRRKRLAAWEETCEILAQAPAVKGSLEGAGAGASREQFIRRFLELRPKGEGAGRARTGDAPERLGTGPGGSPGPNRPGPDGNRPNPGGGAALPVMGVINMEGEATHFGPGIAKRAKAQRTRTAERLRELADDPSQRITYVVLPGEGPQRTRVQEVVVTPVKGDGDSVIGWFFLGIDAETRIERAFQQTEEVSGGDGRSGLVVDGEWFVKGVSPGEAKDFTAAASESLWAGGDPEVVEVDGEQFLMVARDLNPRSVLGKGYQLAIFPLADLFAAIKRLRGVVCVLGGCAVLITALVAFLLARRISLPIAALVAGTERVRQGNLEGDVVVKSKDEFGQLAGAFNAMTHDLALKERYREVLGKVSDPGVAQRLVEGDLELGGEVREAAVLFCDIRGFTAMTEGMDPREVIAIVNEHMTAMTKLIYLHGGVVDKFVGDLVMAVFGVPTSGGNDAEDAAQCAHDMMEERRRLNETTGRVVEMGIGVAFGELVAGCMGSQDRLNYTVLGDRVNLASRLCTAAGPGEVLVDPAVADALGEDFSVEAREAIRLKGFSGTVEVFELRGSG